MGREGDGAEAPAEFRAIGELVATARRIAVVSHDRPDGDAIGSCVAFGLILESLGKEVACFNCDPVPESLRFLPEIERVRMPDSSFRPELVVALDAAGRDRIGETAWTACRQARAIVNIDHHVSNTRYGDVVLVDAGAPATGPRTTELRINSTWVSTKLRSPAARWSKATIGGVSSTRSQEVARYLGSVSKKTAAAANAAVSRPNGRATFHRLRTAAKTVCTVIGDPVSAWPPTTRGL